MIRLLGAITGSALALAALLVLVGVPQFKARQSELEQVVVTLPLRAEPVDDLLPDRNENAQAAVAASDTAAPEPVDTLPAPQPTEPVVETRPAETLAAEQPATVVAEPAILENPPALQPDTQQWYAFWSPFRSEIAASGFVTQLQRVTGLDYRVVKIKPGVYEVAFAYAEDTDIPNNLSQISAATGLDMPGN
jgi:hypothetical protein